MNSYAHAVFELSVATLRMQADAAAGRPIVPANHQREIARVDEIRTESREPAPRLSELPNPHDD